MVTDPDLAKPRTAWTDVVATKRAIRTQLIEKHRDASKSSSSGIKITENADISSLTQLLELGQISAEDVVKAYIIK